MDIQTEKKLILYITPFASPNIGGVESSIDKHIKYSIKRGYYPLVITYQPLTTRAQGAKHEIGNGYEIIRVSWFGMGWFNKLESKFVLSFLYLFPGLFLKSLFWYLKNHKKVYCIHTHGLVSALIGKILTLIYPKRLVSSTHAVYRFKERKVLSFLVKKVLDRADKILAVSEVAREELITLGFSSDLVGVHKNFVDTDRLIPAEEGRVGEEFNLLFIGRLLEKKGILLFTESAKKLPQFKFHVVGNGPMGQKVEEACKVAKNLIYHGVLNQNKPEDFSMLLKLYQNADFLVLPYLYDEGFAAVLVEALACGTPLIVTGRGSPPTFLDKTVAFFLSTEPTVEELVSVIKNLHDKKELFSRKVCRQYALDNFGSINADEIINTYEPTR